MIEQDNRIINTTETKYLNRFKISDTMVFNFFSDIFKFRATLCDMRNQKVLKEAEYNSCSIALKPWLIQNQYCTNGIKQSESFKEFNSKVNLSKNLHLKIYKLTMPKKLVQCYTRSTAICKIYLFLLQTFILYYITYMRQLLTLISYTRLVQVVNPIIYDVVIFIT